MFKKQKSKILVFLLLLGLLYGCKRQILDPLNSQTNLPQKVKLDKVKGFYENGRYKNQPKRTSSNGNERMTAADSARFKDFEPKWDKTVVELLPNNEKMLIVPVVRFLKVDYSQEIAFIRRLCVRVDANEDLIEAHIVEIIGDINFVKNNHNSIFKNYKENSISSFDGAIVVHEIDYAIVSTKQHKKGSVIVSTNQRGCEISIEHELECERPEDQHNCEWVSVLVIDCSGGGGGSSGGSSGGSTESPSPPFPPPGWNTGEGFPSGGSGGTQQSPVYTELPCLPLPPQDPNIPHPQGQTNSPSGCGVDEGENLPEVEPSIPLIDEAEIEENTLDPRTPREKITFDPSLDNYPKLKCVIEAMIGTNNTRPPAKVRMV